MKIVIIGSRSVTDFDLSGYVPKETTLIISGGASGADKLAEEYADAKRISKLILRPQYELYGRAAPLKRTETMIDIADAVIALWDGKSRGTLHAINYANKKSKPVTVINCGD